MNKPVNNHVQARQLNHVQARQQAKTSCAFLRVYNNNNSTHTSSKFNLKINTGLYPGGHPSNYNPVRPSSAVKGNTLTHPCSRVVNWDPDGSWSWVLTIVNLIFCFSGLVSNILPETDQHYETLLKWLDDIAAGVSSWLPCYNTTGDEWNVTDFHTECDYQRATLTLVKVGDYIFGGFSDENWGGIIASCVFLGRTS